MTWEPDGWDQEKDRWLLDLPEVPLWLALMNLGPQLLFCCLLPLMWARVIPPTLVFVAAFILVMCANFALFYAGGHGYLQGGRLWRYFSYRSRWRFNRSSRDAIFAAFRRRSS